MASQISEPARRKENDADSGKEGEGVAERDQDQDNSSGPPEQSQAANVFKRIGPWHPPDYQRQIILAERLSNPILRSSRPVGVTTTATWHHQHQQEESPGQRQNRHQTLSPFLQDSPYYRHPSDRRAVTADGRKPKMMNDNRASSGGNKTSTSSSSSSPQPSPHRPHMSSLATPHYGQVPPRRQAPLFPTPATTRKVTEEELDIIVERVTKPTVASRGGVDLKDKDFTYIPTPRLKTLPVVPGLERRYLGQRKVDGATMEQIVERLTRMTSAYTAKFAPNRNVYIDMEPGAHMVSQRSARSAV